MSATCAKFINLTTFIDEVHITPRRGKRLKCCARERIRTTA